MPFKPFVVSSRGLAIYLKEFVPELTLAELEGDIRRYPKLYYPEYQEFCGKIKTEPVGEGMWIDLCRS